MLSLTKSDSQHQRNSISQELSAQLPEQIQNALSNLSLYPKVYRQIIDDLISYKSQISPTEFRYALVTILALAILETNVDEFTSLHNEVERHEKITQYVYLRAEIAFSKGNTKEEIKNSLLQRIDDVKRVYFRAQEKDCLHSFFRDAFTGPPCFNGRLLSVQEFEQTQLDFKEFSWGKTDLDKEAIEVEDAICDFQLQNKIDTLPNINEFISFLSTQSNYSEKWGAQLNTEHFQEVFKIACLIRDGGEL